MSVDLFRLNPALDTAALAEGFRRNGRVQVRDVMTAEAAKTLQDLLARGTPWEIAWQAGKNDTPHVIANAALRGQQGPEQVNAAMQQTHASANGGDYTFRYACYPVVRAFLDRRDAGGPFDIILEHLNSPEFLDFARTVTGIPEIVKVDAQASLFSGNHFLGLHDDTGEEAEGRRVAYVLGLAPDEWQPDWGGYLQFFDDNGDIEFGWKPRFNVLNLMAVPCPHAVSYVPPFAPNGRVSITGWFRDR